jgi:uncharacterized membrane protein YphA (DoxX/SURF4 family)
LPAAGPCKLILESSASQSAQQSPTGGSERPAQARDEVCGRSNGQNREKDVLEQHQLLDLLQSGVGTQAGTAALFLNRVVLGLFFSISGFHKLFNSGRHAQLIATLERDHIPLVRLNRWLVPLVEFTGGLALIAGVLAPLVAILLAVECLVAVLVDGWKRIASYRPIDRADWLDDLLYLPEVLAIVALLIVVTLGPGRFTLPSLLA